MPSLVPRFDRRVWMLLVAMLVFRFGQGLYYPFSTIYFHDFVGISLSLVGAGLASWPPRAWPQVSSVVPLPTATAASP